MSAADIVFRGRFRPESFAAFARHRAAKLDLHLTLTLLATDEIGVTVSGADDLVDAFEMACSLGPLDCLVLDLARHPGARA